MNIPTHWIRVTGRVPGGRGIDELAAWGWSDRDRADAERVAHERLSRLIERVQRGEPLPSGYAYGDRPLREEIVQTLPGTGSPEAIITRNSYGSIVLNARRLMFIDVDRPAPPRTGLLARLFGKGPSAEAIETEALARLRAALDALPGSYRLYSTAAGWRVIATHGVFDPCANTTQDLMESLGADPAYRRLCSVQHCFRARLTPKPWRCGQPMPPGRHPREDGALVADFEQWRRRYDAACEAKATCRYLESIPDDRIDGGLESLVDIHDAETRAYEALPLA